MNLRNLFLLKYNFLNIMYSDIFYLQFVNKYTYVIYHLKICKVNYFSKDNKCTISGLEGRHIGEWR